MYFYDDLKTEQFQSWKGNWIFWSTQSKKFRALKFQKIPGSRKWDPRKSHPKAISDTHTNLKFAESFFSNSFCSELCVDQSILACHHRCSLQYGVCEAPVVCPITECPKCPMCPPTPTCPTCPSTTEYKCPCSTMKNTVERIKEDINLLMSMVNANVFETFIQLLGNLFKKSRAGIPIIQLQPLFGFIKRSKPPHVSNPPLISRFQPQKIKQDKEVGFQFSEQLLWVFKFFNPNFFCFYQISCFSCMQKYFLGEHICL